ncbi:unnamed protein product [Amoebophrya sp. A120]|nr:unnamed protein product [Amoebophrya sp. A120]|eukprot:GSA120T00022259001.1
MCVYMKMASLTENSPRMFAIKNFDEFIPRPEHPAIFCCCRYGVSDRVRSLNSCGKNMPM